MPNLMQRSAEWLSDRLKVVAGRSVLYRRGVVSTLSLTGTASEESYKVTGSDGLFTWVHTSDWVFAVSDMEGIEPLPGDRICETLGNVDRVYEVLPISDDEPCWKQLDSGNAMIVVHTKRIE